MSSSDVLSELLSAAARQWPPALAQEVAQKLEAGASPAQIERAFHSVASRRLWSQIEAEWQNSAVPALALALGLRCALRQHQWHQGNEPELVWTGPNSSNNTWRRTEQVLLELIESSQKVLWLVTFAAYRVASVAEALQRAQARGVSLRFVAESNESGKIRGDFMRNLGDSLPWETQIYIWPLDKRPRNKRGDYGTLHAKCAVADHALALVSSANLTDCALNFNMETGVLLRGEWAHRIALQLEDLVQTGVLKEVGKPSIEVGRDIKDSAKVASSSGP